MTLNDGWKKSRLCKKLPSRRCDSEKECDVRSGVEVSGQGGEREAASLGPSRRAVMGRARHGSGQRSRGSSGGTADFARLD